jgi:hypothetical protein
MTGRSGACDLYVNSDTQEVCTEAEMCEAFTSAENDDIRGSQASCRRWHSDMADIVEQR